MISLLDEQHSHYISHNSHNDVQKGVRFPDDRVITAILVLVIRRSTQSNTRLVTVSILRTIISHGEISLFFPEMSLDAEITLRMTQMKGILGSSP